MIQLAAALLVAATGQEIGLSWPDQPSCPPRAEVIREIERLIGRSLLSQETPTSTFETSVTSAGDRWRATLVTNSSAGRSRRQLEGASCHVIAQAVAVIIALALGEAETEPVVTKTATVSTATVATATRAPVVPPPRVVPRDRGTRFAVRGSFAAGHGHLPRTAVGFLVLGGVIFDQLRFDAGFSYLHSQEEVVRENPDLGGEVQVLNGMAKGCYLPLVAPVEGLLCLGTEVGAVLGSGLGVPDPQSKSRIWLAFFGGLGIAVPVVEPFFLLLEVEGALPITRPTFVLEDQPNPIEIHRPSVVTLRGSVGVEARFP